MDDSYAVYQKICLPGNGINASFIARQNGQDWDFLWMLLRLSDSLLSSMPDLSPHPRLSTDTVVLILHSYFYYLEIKCCYNQKSKVFRLTLTFLYLRMSFPRNL